MRSTPDNFEEAVIGLMKRYHITIRQAFNRAKKEYPHLYLADRTVTEGFSANSWFVLIREAKYLAADQKISLGAALKKVYAANPQLLKECLGRDFL